MATLARAQPRRRRRRRVNAAKTAMLAADVLERPVRILPPRDAQEVPRVRDQIRRVPHQRPADEKHDVLAVDLVHLPHSL
eukprot:31366-Pelagococcus_subviridis.AAC.10